MPSLDDEQFERYLKQFRPSAPEALPVNAPERATRRSFILAWAGGAACVLAVALSVHFPATAPHSGDRADNAAADRKVTTQEPLTLGRANALLAESPSVKNALDGLAFHSQPAQLRSGELSALNVLSKEKSKL